MEFYRIHIKGKISYSQISENCIDYNKSSKKNKLLIIQFIRSFYQNLNIRLIIKGAYKAIYGDGYLVGVQFDMNYLQPIK